MFELQGLHLMHWHGGNDWVRMEEGEHTNESHDPERSWLKGARIFTCGQCPEKVAVLNEAPEPREDHPHPAV